MSCVGYTARKPSSSFLPLISWECLLAVIRPLIKLMEHPRMDGLYSSPPQSRLTLSRDSPWGWDFLVHGREEPGPARPSVKAKASNLWHQHMCAPREGYVSDVTTVSMVCCTARLLKWCQLWWQDGCEGCGLGCNALLRGRLEVKLQLRSSFYVWKED